MKFVNNIKTSFANTAVADANNDRADLVQTVLLIAGFAIAALILVNWVSTAILNQASNAATCIEGANSYGKDNAAKATKACQDGDGTNKSYKTSTSYTGRY